ncbi:MAG: hypothetical protein IJT50_11010 [Lentisphaeria bacterium]|nr:hypothetical protein [Lentisphaeria bacterium]
MDHAAKTGNAPEPEGKVDGVCRRTFSPAPALALAGALTLPALTVFVGNLNQFTLSPGQGIGAALTFFCGAALLFMLPLFFGRGKRCCPWIAAGMLGVAVSCALQYLVLGELFLKDWPDGGEFLPDMVLLAVFHLFCLLLPVGAALVFRNFCVRHGGKLAAILLLILGTPMAELFFTRQKAADYDFREYTFSEEEKFAFGRRENIILLVVDAMSERTAKVVLTKYPELQDSLRDFTCFDRMTSPIPSTAFAVPAMLTGKMFRGKLPPGSIAPSAKSGTPEGDEHARYLNEAFRDKGALPSVCRSMGYRVEGYPLIPQCLSLSPEVIDNSLPITDEVREMSLRQIVETALDRQLPFFLKPLWESMHTSALTPFVEEQPEGFTPFVKDYDPIFYRKLHREFRVGKHDKVFKYLHLRGSHVPVATDENLELRPGVERHRQLRGSLKAAELLLKKLKSAGLYERAMIVITGDHTEQYRPETITFVKRPGETHRKIVFNSAPCRVDEIAGTIARECGLRPESPSICARQARSGGLRTPREKALAVLRLPPLRPVVRQGPLEYGALFGGVVTLDSGGLQIEMEVGFDRSRGIVELYAENAENGRSVMTASTYERRFDCVRLEKFDLAPGIYRLFVGGHFDPGASAAQGVRAVRYFLAVDAKGMRFLAERPVLKPRPLELGESVTFREMGLYPQLVLPEKHILNHRALLLESGAKLGVRLPHEQGPLALEFHFSRTLSMQAGTLKVTAEDGQSVLKRFSGEEPEDVRLVLEVPEHAGEACFTFEYTLFSRKPVNVRNLLRLEKITLKRKN